jgi:hypothetical protein
MRSLQARHPDAPPTGIAQFAGKPTAARALFIPVQSENVPIAATPFLSDAKSG